MRNLVAGGCCSFTLIWERFASVSFNSKATSDQCEGLKSTWSVEHCLVAFLNRVLDCLMCVVTWWKWSAVYFLLHWSVLIKTWPFYTFILSGRCLCYTCFSSNIYFSLLYILFQPGLVIITQLLSCGFLQVGNVALYIFGFDWKPRKIWLLDKVSFLADRNIQYTALHSCPVIRCILLSFR